MDVTLVPAVVSASLFAQKTQWGPASDDSVLGLTPHTGLSGAEETALGKGWCALVSFPLESRKMLVVVF